jgi:hypothetical protein
LFWQLVLAVERGAAAVLGWSRWRRWHQAWARYHRYRGQKKAPAAQERESTSQGGGWEHLPKAYPAWKTVHRQLMDWQKRGIWRQIWRDSDQPRLEEQLQL